MAHFLKKCFNTRKAKQPSSLRNVSLSSVVNLVSNLRSSITIWAIAIHEFGLVLKSRFMNYNCNLLIRLATEPASMYYDSTNVQVAQNTVSSQADGCVYDKSNQICSTCMLSFYPCLTVRPIQLFISLSTKELHGHFNTYRCYLPTQVHTEREDKHQCDQMAGLLFYIGPFLTDMKVCLIA